MSRKPKSVWLLILFLIAGFVIGSFVGQYINIDKLSQTWQFGIRPEQPVILNLGVVRMAFALIFEFSIAGVVGLLLGALLYKLY